MTTYRTMMVYVDPIDKNDSALRVACDLAGQFDAQMIGLTAGFPNAPMHADGLVASNILEANDEEIKNAMVECGNRFRYALGAACNFGEWREEIAVPAVFLAQEARAADLIIVDRIQKQRLSQKISQKLYIGDVVMQAGRPTLIVPPRKTCLPLNQALIAWKDTVETRRAVSAALPLLRKIKNAMLVEIVAAESEKHSARNRLLDVANWLERHEIASTINVELSAGDAGNQLDFIAVQNGVDVIIAGAYGHSRLQEWVFGGVTQYFLHHATTCTLMMH